MDEGDIPVYGSGGYMLSVNDYLFDGESACIGRKGTINNPMFLSGKFWTVDTLFYTHTFKNCLPKYVYYLFQSIDWLKYNEAGGVPSLSKTNIYQIETLISHPKEQKKIASCLSSLDELIAAHNDKLNALNDHKKGLMQNLFPQEGETVPKVRFKEFEDDGEWVEKRFEELFEIGSGKDYKHLEEGKIPVYGSGGYMLSVNKHLHNGESAAIGRKGTINNPLFLKGKFWTVDTLFFTRNFNDCIPKFIFYIFQKINWLQHNEAGGIPSLSKSNIYKIKTLLPKLSEQNLIVEAISSVDDLILSQEKMIEELTKHKKGLIQGLFLKNRDSCRYCQYKDTEYCT